MVRARDSVRQVVYPTIVSCYTKEITSDNHKLLNESNSLEKLM